MTVRVVHVVESLEPEAGSVAISLRGLLAALPEAGVESTTVTLDAGIAGGFDPSAVTQKVDRSDIVHVHGWSHKLARTAARAAVKLGKPYVISPHGALANGVYTRKSWRGKLRTVLSENRLIRRAAAVTALNETEKRDLRSAKISANIIHLPSGLDGDEYDPARTGPGTLSDGPEGRCLLMLGPIHPIEGLVPLLRAVSEIGPECDGWNIVIAGRETGDWRKMLEAAIRRKGGEGRVRFAAAADTKTQRAWLARASIVVSPCLQVRFPASIMQAMAFGVAAVASSCVAPTGSEEAVRVCAPSRGDMKVALRSLIGLSDDDREALARKARDLCRTLLDWPVLVEQYVRLYKASL